MQRTRSMATRLGWKLTDVRKEGDLWCLPRDGKAEARLRRITRRDGLTQLSCDLLFNVAPVEKSEDRRR